MAGALTAKDVFADAFSRHAAAYRARIMGDPDLSRHRGRARVVEAIAAQPGAQVLDLACGPGTLTLPLAEAVGPSGRVVAVDLAEGMLDLLRGGAPPQVEVRRMDVEELDFPDAAFDAVACGHGLHFCPNLLRALWQARRVLRPGGVFAASVPGPGRGLQAGDLMADAFAGLPGPPDAPDRSSTVECLGDPARARAALLAAGFREAVVTTLEEAVSYDSPEDLVAQSLGWWWCASRLEHLDPGARAEVERRAVEVVRGKIGNGRIDLRGSTHVLEARR